MTREPGPLTGKAPSRTANGSVESTTRHPAIKQFVLLLALGTGVPAHGARQPESPSTEDQTAMATEAEAAARRLGSALKAELEAALRSSGTVAALGTCRIKAIEIAARISAETGMQVSRTSLKPRNPYNAPNEWQHRVLRTFETRNAAGEDPATLNYSTVVDEEFRFMKAIPTAPVCLACHGDQLMPEVSARLAELYPHDQATGFRVGDLRGAFVILRRLATKP